MTQDAAGEPAPPPVTGPRQRPTIRDVAAVAGVSPMTVSRALHDDPRVAATTRERVLAAAAELGYRRNELARNLRLGRNSGLVGLVVTNLANPFYSQLALGVESVAGERALKVVLGNTAEDPQRERRLIEELVSRRVDGVIVVPAGGDHSHLERRHVGAPVVLAARPPANLEADCVLVDDFGGARDATARLLATGARRLGFLGLPASVWTTSERLRGFSAALEEAGVELDERFVRRHRGTIDSAEEAARELLSMPDPPDGLFCANSRTTMGAFRAVSIAGSTMALAGFDDFELADMLGIPLILVAYDPGELGRQAARLLEERMTAGGDAELPPRRIVVPTTVVEYGRE